MSSRGLFFGLVAIGSALFFWRKRRGDRERLDLYYADGSMISFAPDAADTASLFSLASDVVGAAKKNEA